MFRVNRAYWWGYVQVQVRDQETSHNGPAEDRDSTNYRDTMLTDDRQC